MTVQSADIHVIKRDRTYETVKEIWKAAPDVAGSLFCELPSGVKIRAISFMAARISRSAGIYRIYNYYSKKFKKKYQGLRWFA